MESPISDIKALTSIPEKYWSNPKAIEYLYQNNPKIFENVTNSLNLSFDFIERITELINNGTIVLTKNNIKLLDSLYPDNIIDILKNHFNYLYLITQDNFDNTGIARDYSFFELLEEHQIEITDNAPYLVTLCSDYIIKQYKENKVNLEIVLPYFINWYNLAQRTFIQEYLNKGNKDLSIFYYKDIYNDNIIPFFENISLEIKEGNAIIKSDNINSVLSLLNFDLPFSISDIYLLDNRNNEPNIINLLKIAKEKNINLHVKDGLSISSTLEKDSEFLELSGDLGTIELSPFNLEEFNKLLMKVLEHPGIVINVKLDDFMHYEKYFLNLNTKVPVNIISKEKASILTLDEMKKLNSKLDSIANNIKNSSLSPYEKFIAAYNIVKSFKNYRFYLDSEGLDELIPDQSRNPYLVLSNKYIVCAGYTSLLHILLEKIGISSHEWTLNTSEKSEAASDNPKDNSSHVRLYVNIVDEKYGINGYFMCDPTWDNVEKEESDLYGYKYLSMACGQSHDYGKNSPSYYYFSDDYEVFNDQMFIDTENYLENPDSLNEIMVTIKDLDPDFYLHLSKLNSKEEQKEEIKKHFKEKTYRAIPLEKKYSAIISVLEFQNKKEFSTNEKQLIKETLYNIDYDMDNPTILKSNENDDYFI